MDQAFYFVLWVSLKIFIHVGVFYFSGAVYFRPVTYREEIDTGLGHVANCIYNIFLNIFLLLSAWEYY